MDRKIKELQLKRSQTTSLQISSFVSLFSPLYNSNAFFSSLRGKSVPVWVFTQELCLSVKTFLLLLVKFKTADYEF